MYFDKGKLLKYSISKCLKVFFCSNVLVKIDLLVFLLVGFKNYVVKYVNIEINEKFCNFLDWYKIFFVINNYLSWFFIGFVCMF